MFLVLPTLLGLGTRIAFVASQNVFFVLPTLLRIAFVASQADLSMFFFLPTLL